VINVFCFALLSNQCVVCVICLVHTVLLVLYYLQYVTASSGNCEFSVWH